MPARAARGRQLGVAWALVGLFAASCGPSIAAGNFPGAIAFVNESRTAIYVSQVEGLQHDAACGNLMAEPQGVKTLWLEVMPLPREVRIRWHELHDATEAPRLQAVSLAGVRVPDRGEQLIFAFGPDERWTVETGEVYGWLRARGARGDVQPGRE